MIIGYHLITSDVLYALVAYIIVCVYLFCIAYNFHLFKTQIYAEKNFLKVSNKCLTQYTALKILAYGPNMAILFASFKKMFHEFYDFTTAISFSKNERPASSGSMPISNIIVHRFTSPTVRLTACVSVEG